jgi:hypothetical protein
VRAVVAESVGDGAGSVRAAVSGATVRQAVRRTSASSPGTAVLVIGTVRL